MKFETQRKRFARRFHEGIPTIQLGGAKVDINESENYADVSDYQLINLKKKTIKRMNKLIT